MLRKLFTLRAVILLLCCAGVIGGMGCVSMWAHNGHRQRQHDYYFEPALNDTILGFGQPDAKLKDVLGTNEVIALLGEKKTYLLVEGAAAITNVAAQIDSPKLHLYTYKSLYRKGDAIWGEITIIVPVVANEYFEFNMTGSVKVVEHHSDETLERLTSLGFKQESLRTGHSSPNSIVNVKGYRYGKFYALHIPVKGIVRPPVKLNAAATKKVQRTYSFALYNPPESEPPPDLGYWLVKMPLAVVADVALTPVYILGALVLVISVPFM